MESIVQPKTSQKIDGNLGAAPDFRALFESAPGLYLVLSPALEVAAVSDAYLRATKTKREDILGRHVFDILPAHSEYPDATAAGYLRASFERVLKHQVADAMATQKYDIRRPEAEGGGFDERHWRPTNSPVFAPDGSLAYIIHGVEDATEVSHLRQREAEQQKLASELREAERAYHQNEDRLRLFAENAKDIIFRYRVMPTLGFEYVSPAATEITGYTPEEHYADPFLGSRIVHPDDKPLLEAMQQNPAATSDAPLVLRWVRKDGRVIWTEQQLRLVRDAAGTPIAIEGIARDITERKQSEADLKLHSVILHQMAEGVVLVSATSETIVYANPKFEAMFGYEPGELVGFPVSVLNYAPDAAGAAAVARDILTQLYERGAASYEIHNVRKDGTSFWCHVSTSGFEHAEHGAVWVAVHEDITEWKLAEAERTAVAAKFRTLLEGAPDAVVIASASGRIEIVNARTEAVFGYQRGELVGQPLEILVPAALKARHAVHRERFVAAPQARLMAADLDLRARRKDGTEFPAEISLAPMWSEDGLLVVAAVRDVTDRRRADDERARLAAIVESSDDAIIGKTLDGVIESWNVGAERLYGYTFAEVRGQPIAMLVPRDRLDEIRQALATVRLGNQVSSYETVRIRKDGSLADVSVSHSPIRDRIGRVMGIASIGRDISLRKRAERLVLASLAEKDVLLQEIHHRVKNNLQVISTLLKLHASRAREPEARVALQDSQDRVHSIALLHEKLYGSKDLGSIDMAEYSSSLALTLLRAHGDSAGQVDLHVHGQGVRLPVNLALPCGLILNELLTNAFKHAFGARTGPQSVSVTMSRHGRELEFCVADNGAGFPPGFAVAASTTLGMHLIRTLAGQLDGSLEFVNDGGARCTLRFSEQSEGENRDAQDPSR